MLGYEGQRSAKLLELIGVRRGFLPSSRDTFRTVAEVRVDRDARCSVEAIGFPCRRVGRSQASIGGSQRVGWRKTTDARLIAPILE